MIRPSPRNHNISPLPSRGGASCRPNAASYKLNLAHTYARAIATVPSTENLEGNIRHQQKALYRRS